MIDNLDDMPSCESHGMRYADCIVSLRCSDFLGGPHTVAAVTHGAIATACDLTSAPPYPLRLHADIDIFLRKDN